MTLALPSVQRTKSLHEQIYQTLRASILSGELAPGDRLIETQLAEKLQVSRTPVREAIRQLQQETLVTPDASGGLRVTTISVTDAAQLYDCRIALEQLSVQGACLNATVDQLQQIERFVKQAEQLMSQPLTEQHSSQILELDYQFHRAIAESSGNRWLVAILDQLFDKMALLRVQTTRHNPRSVNIYNEHRGIYEAIVERNETSAMNAIRTHLAASKARVIQEVETLQRRAIGG